MPARVTQKTEHTIEVPSSVLASTNIQTLGDCKFSLEKDSLIMYKYAKI